MGTLGETNYFADSTGVEPNSVKTPVGRSRMRREDVVKNGVEEEEQTGRHDQRLTGMDGTVILYDMGWS